MKKQQKPLDIQDYSEQVRRLKLVSVQGSPYWERGFDSGVYREYYFHFRQIPTRMFHNVLAMARDELLNGGTGSYATKAVIYHCVPFISKVVTEFLSRYYRKHKTSFFDLVNECVAKDVCSCIRSFDPVKSGEVDPREPEAAELFLIYWNAYLKVAVKHTLRKLMAMEIEGGVTVGERERFRYYDLQNIIKDLKFVPDPETLSEIYSARFPSRKPLTESEIEYLLWLPEHDRKWILYDSTMEETTSLNPENWQGSNSQKAVDPAEACHLSAMWEDIKQALDDPDEPYLTVFKMKLEGYSFAEIGQSLGKDRHYSRARYDTAIRRLRKSQAMKNHCESFFPVNPS